MSTIFVKKLFEPWGKVYFGNSPDVDRIRCILRGRSGKYGRSSADYRRSFGFPGDGTDDVRVICAGRSALGRSGIAGISDVPFMDAHYYDRISCGDPCKDHPYQVEICGTAGGEKAECVNERCGLRCR